MQVGDLVMWRLDAYTNAAVGLIVEAGKYAGNADVKVLWNRGVDSEKPHVHNSKFLRLVDDSLTT